MDLRVGLIGYRLGGAAFHAPFIATTPGLHLDAIVTSNPERRQQAVRDHPGVRLFDRADQLWAPGARIDLVVVASVAAVLVCVTWWRVVTFPLF
jgi:predicted dehydrogenase